jgi:glycosyltransferase involved in cell wall biosynthesis
VNVLAVSSYGGLGGGEIAFSVFLEERPADFDGDVLLVSDGPLRELLEAQGLRVRATDGCVGRPTARMLASFHRRFDRILRDGEYDVVWAVGQKAALMTALACRRRRVPLVWHKIDFSWDRVLPIPLAIASTCVVTVSSAVADTLGPMRSRRPVAIAGPPVSLARPVDPRPQVPTIGTLARLVPYKGQHLMIEAAGRLRERFPSIRVLLAGEPAPQYPDYPERLRQTAREQGLEDAVDMPGFIATEDALERLSVFVNATYRDDEGFGFEGLSGAMLEASAAGLPVVATIGGGTAEGVRDGITGQLVAQPDPAAIAAAIEPYLADPQLAKEAGAAGRDFVCERFSPEAVAERLWACVRAAAQPRSGTSAS